MSTSGGAIQEKHGYESVGLDAVAHAAANVNAQNDVRGRDCACKYLQMHTHNIMQVWAYGMGVCGGAFHPSPHQRWS